MCCCTREIGVVSIGNTFDTIIMLVRTIVKAEVKLTVSRPCQDGFGHHLSGVGVVVMVMPLSFSVEYSLILFNLPRDSVLLS